MMLKVTLVVAASAVASIWAQVLPPPANGSAALLPLVQAEGLQSNDPLFSDVPEFVSTNISQTVSPGESTVISCQVNKLGSFQVIWHRRHSSEEDWKVLRVGSTPVLIKEDDPRYKFEGQSTVLRIDDVRVEDEGLYKCEIAVQNSPKVYVELKVGEDPASVGGANGARTWPSSGGTATMAAMLSTLSALLILCFL